MPKNQPTTTDIAKPWDNSEVYTLWQSKADGNDQVVGHYASADAAIAAAEASDWHCHGVENGLYFEKVWS